MISLDSDQNRRYKYEEFKLDGTLIERARGKAYLANPNWRQTVERIVEIVEEIRKRFQEAVGFNRMLYEHRRMLYEHQERMSSRRPDQLEELMERSFRGNSELAKWMDQQRQEAIQSMNSILLVVRLRKETSEKTNSSDESYTSVKV